MNRFEKIALETITIETQFNNALTTGEIITDATCVCYLNDLTVEDDTNIVSDTTYTDTSVFVKLVSGAIGLTYILRITAITDNGNAIIKDLEMVIIDEIPLDPMAQEAVLIGGLTDSEDKVAAITKQLLNSICSYCNNSFFMQTSYGQVFETRSSTLLDKTITPATDYTLPLMVNDYIRITNSKYNDGLYKITSIISGVITVDTILRPETCSLMIFLVQFPVEFSTIIANYVNSTHTNGNVKREKMGTVEYEYFNTSNVGFLADNSHILNPYRFVYKKGTWR